MNNQITAIAQKLTSIVGSNGVSDWEDIKGIRRRQIEAITPNPTCIVYPHTQAELAEVIACAHHNKWCVLPCGNGSKLSWGGLVEVQLVVSTQRLNQLIQHAVGDLTITAEAGTKFADVQNILATAGQFLALDPTAPESATMGGIVATADTGSWRQRYGGVRDQLLGISFVRADGQIAKAGGRVVKNVAGYDLMKLFTGSYGTLGIITSVTFRVYPLPEASGTVVLTGEVEAIAQAYITQRSSALVPTAADLLSSRLVARLGIGQGLGFITRFQSIPESVNQQSTTLLQLGQQLGLQGAIYTAGDEADLWQKIREQMSASPTEPVITCKIGVLPSASVATLTQLDGATQSGIGLIHSGSGLGLLRFENGAATAETILEMRLLCQTQGGFLTLLEAPVSLKQQIDAWGYNGNTIDLMRRIKQQFDPKNLLSPHSFVGGI